MVMNIRLEVTNIPIDKVGETAHESVGVSACVWLGFHSLPQERSLN